MAEKGMADLSGLWRVRPHDIEHFQFETLCISNHTACRFAEKRVFRSLRAGRRHAAASRSIFFQR